MLLIDRLIAAGTQTFTITTEDDPIDLACTLRFLPTQNMWVLDIVSDEFTVYGLVLRNNVNILRQYRRNINFGILIGSLDNVDPYRVDDFETERSSFRLLNQFDVDTMELVIDEV